MPQMAPLLWFNLMLMFLVCFMLFITMNYFMFKYSQISTPKSDYMNEEKNWKW
uniref:ATP synthase complex subunit 8 n=1 Tax=Gastroptychus investigatoris TaxID=2020971 RepID=A0A3Q8B8L4_9EUCA|nr:ATP synthase F0 subunit 8 [Gastroptychus investigatoris]